MFDFLLSKEEKNKRLFATNFTIAFELLPKLCKRVCTDLTYIKTLNKPSAWKSELKTMLGKNYYGRKLPQIWIWRVVDKKGGKAYYKATVSYTTTGMINEPICSVIVIEIFSEEYRMFCMEKSMGNQYSLCGIAENRHVNYGIQYDGLKIEEFIDTAFKKAFEEL